VTLSRKRIHLIGALLLMVPASGMAQTVNPYYMNGSATQDNCSCYTITQDQFNIHGSVWNVNKIDLTQPIDFKFSVFLGYRDVDGADGIAFVLQPISTQIGTAGGGIGLEGVKPSMAVVLDTWQNAEYNDPVYDHISITANGDLNHNTPNNLDGPVRILEGNDNAEDGQWHLLYVKWDPATKTLSASVDDKPRVTVTKDIVVDIFNGDPMVFWGFTASTGGARNLQRFCTALNPGMKSMETQETCFGKPVQFRDSSNSFSRIVSWFWDLGDGTTSTLQDPPPHTYAAPGYYDVKMVIQGNNGCTSDTSVQKVTIGTYPFAKIGYAPQPYCEGDPLTLLDSSGVQFGTVNNWTWTTSAGTYTTQNPTLAKGLPTGAETVSLLVRTKEGCISSPVNRTFSVLPKPRVDFTANNACVGDAVNITGLDQYPASPVGKWVWDLGDGRRDSSGASLSVYYDTGNDYPIILKATAVNGCAAKLVTHLVSIWQTNAFAGNDTTIATGQSLQLKGSGGVLYQWWPPTYLSDPSIPDPISLPDHDIRYILKAYTPAGCPSYDTISIRVFKGPEIYVPTAFTPNGDGLNDLLHVIPIGVTLDYFRVFNRWGQRVFETIDPKKGWDGLVNGYLNPGNYTWIVSGRDFNRQLIRKTGIVTLIR
jgi:gliding motility-associated-like protein